MNELHTEPDMDKTVPPRRAIRFDTPTELFSELPEIAKFLSQPPEEDEDNHTYLERLRNSNTPEDAVTFAAFVAETRDTINWGAKALRSLVQEPGPQDAQILRWVDQWLESPSNETRWRTLQIALFAPERTPAVYLGLAVGWSGGPIAPNDPSDPPVWRAPRAVNTAVLSALSYSNIEHRRTWIARVVDLAHGLFRGF